MQKTTTERGVWDEADFASLCYEIHQVAKEHGWWEGNDRLPEEIACLIHSEWSEALEEYRNGRPMVYALDPDADDDAPLMIRSWDTIREQKLKPEGIATEIIDGVIRIMDYIGWLDEVELASKAPIDIQAKLGPGSASLPRVLAKLHSLTARACEYQKIEPTHTILGEQYLRATVSHAISYLDRIGVDWRGVLELKEDYNKTRPYRHGGKAL